MIEDILADPALEALRVALDHGISAFSDTINSSGFIGSEE
jgi:hypothetical protein